MDEPQDWPILAHADFGAEDCCGCLWPVIRGDQADITCNECAVIVCTVTVADLQRTYDEMELSLEAFATEMCPNYGHVIVFPGWSTMMAYTCRSCGKVVRLSDDPNVERIFGPDESE
jgi:hypothetical protein